MFDMWAYHGGPRFPGLRVVTGCGKSDSRATMFLASQPLPSPTDVVKDGIQNHLNVYTTSLGKDRYSLCPVPSHLVKQGSGITQIHSGSTGFPLAASDADPDSGPKSNLVANISAYSLPKPTRCYSAGLSPTTPRAVGGEVLLFVLHEQDWLHGIVLVASREVPSSRPDDMHACLHAAGKGRSNALHRQHGTGGPRRWSS